MRLPYRIKFEPRTKDVPKWLPFATSMGAIIVGQWYVGTRTLWPGPTPSSSSPNAMAARPLVVKHVWGSNTFCMLAERRASHERPASKSKPLPPPGTEAAPAPGLGSLALKARLRGSRAHRSVG